MHARIPPLPWRGDRGGIDKERAAVHRLADSIRAAHSELVGILQKRAKRSGALRFAHPVHLRLGQAPLQVISLGHGQQKVSVFGNDFNRHGRRRLPADLGGGGFDESSCGPRLPPINPRWLADDFDPARCHRNATVLVAAAVERPEPFPTPEGGTEGGGLLPHIVKAKRQQMLKWTDALTAAAQPLREERDHAHSMLRRGEERRTDKQLSTAAAFIISEDVEAHSAASCLASFVRKVSDDERSRSFRAEQTAAQELALRATASSMKLAAAVRIQRTHRGVSTRRWFEKTITQLRGGHLCVYMAKRRGEAFVALCTRRSRQQKKCQSISQVEITRKNTGDHLDADLVWCRAAQAALDPESIDRKADASCSATKLRKIFACGGSQTSDETSSNPQSSGAAVSRIRALHRMHVKEVRDQLLFYVHREIRYTLRRQAYAQEITTSIQAQLEWVQTEADALFEIDGLAQKRLEGFFPSTSQEQRHRKWLVGQRERLAEQLRQLDELQDYLFIQETSE